MIERTIDWCASNRFLVFTGTVVLTVWGIWAMTKTPLDAVPDISDVQVIVSTEWMGRSPDLIEDQITYPIVDRLTVIRNAQRFGFSLKELAGFLHIRESGGTPCHQPRRQVRTVIGLSASRPERGTAKRRTALASRRS